VTERDDVNRTLGGGSAPPRRMLAEAMERFGEPLAIFAAVRLALMLLVYFGHILVPISPGTPPAAYPRDLLLDGWKYWDGGWYTSIAEGGYFFRPPPEGSSVAFFPLYPLLMRAASVVVGNTSNAGLLVSNVCMALSMCLLYSFVRERWGRDVAFRTIVLLVVYPLGFYLGALYTESLFLLLAVASFWLAEREKWWLAGLAGMLATLTRQMGLVLGPALLLLYLGKRRYDPRRVGPDVLALGLIPLGIVLYMAYLYVQFGDPLAFYRVTLDSFGHANVFRDGLGIINPRTLGAVDFRLLLLFNFVFGVAFVLAAVPVARRVGLSYAAFTLLAAGIPMLVGLISLGRYMSVVFPVFILLGQVIRNRLVFNLFVASSALLMGLLAVLFANRYWVF
jgi:Dolichyl-phosphate-mannose-protein mannosyltransferase